MRITVHPRPRGEHPTAAARPSSPAGSSPPARGTRLWRRSIKGSSRFIPARAGNTWAETKTELDGAVHPRPRGEHPTSSGAACFLTGSSPPARGTPYRETYRSSAVRFIPARAGNTPRKSTRAAISSVHPRPRGEHLIASAEGLISTGSSPPARGTPQLRVTHYRTLRFIPARAGNTRVESAGARLDAVHPRPRGEHRYRKENARVVIGSSPPARGTPGRGDRLCAGQRFIPARAGNTGEGNDRRTTVEVHPRPRGEHSLSSLSMAVSAGSSPPARGTPYLCAAHAGRLRFIPARAGNTA